MCDSWRATCRTTQCINYLSLWTSYNFTFFPRKLNFLWCIIGLYNLSSPICTDTSTVFQVSMSFEQLQHWTICKLEPRLQADRWLMLMVVWWKKARPIRLGNYNRTSEPCLHRLTTMQQATRFATGFRSLCDVVLVCFGFDLAKREESKQIIYCIALA